MRYLLLQNFPSSIIVGVQVKKASEIDIIVFEIEIKRLKTK